jgi:hypothetical protein
LISTDLFTIDELNIAIARLKNNKSSILDNIKAEYLKAADEELRCVILRLMNNIFEREEYPDSWYEGILLPLWK